MIALDNREKLILNILYKLSELSYLLFRRYLGVVYRMKV